MIPLIFTLSLPASALGWIYLSRRPAASEWKVYLQRVALLFVIGLFAAGPFLTNRGLGTSEAYNYSLSVADAVTQFRAGEFPVLVGQSEFAFNGRIHPLRTAPYLAYFACFLDLCSFHQLSFWTLQNLSLATTLIGAVFSAYASLRRATGVRPNLALLLSAGYVLAPGVLAIPYAMDLYMTAMTFPFLPVILCACLRALDGERRFSNFALLAAALAATWLAHPPVALWMTAGVSLLLLPVVFSYRSGRSAYPLLGGAILLGIVLVIFEFASTLTVQTYGDIAAGGASHLIRQEIQNSFRASLLPVSDTASKLGDFQLGYAYEGVLFVSIILAIYRREKGALWLLLAAVLYLSLTTPVPLFTNWVWEHLPIAVLKINGLWPMQRLYLLVTLFSLFAFGRASPSFVLDKLPKFVRDLISVTFAALIGWTVYQSWHFISRGYSVRWDANTTSIAHRPENINLTVISYAILGLPPSFVSGVMDPEMELRLLRRGTGKELASNWTAAAAAIDPGIDGIFSTGAADGQTAQLSPPLTLQPGKRYRIDFEFHSTLDSAVLQFNGPGTRHEYPLPSAGQPRGFGMAPENNHSLTLWTSSSSPEIVDLQLVGRGMGEARLLNFANFKLRELNPLQFPVRLESLFPLRVRVHAPEPAYLETPRMFLDGYTATVNNEPVRVQSSPDRLAMLPVPAGDSVVEVRYLGPRILRVAFWISFAGWCALIVGGGLHIFSPGTLNVVLRSLRAAGARFWRFKLPLSIAVLVLPAALYGWKRWQLQRDSAGPLRIVLVLPQGETGRNQPLVTTGRQSAGTFLFIRYQDSTHLCVGMDVWGQALWVSEPIETDYFAEQEFKISSGALYPLDHPKLRDIPTAQLERLRNRIKVELNGKIVLDRPIFSYDSKISEVTVGESRIGVSNTEAKFVGKIITVERLAVQRDP